MSKSTSQPKAAQRPEGRKSSEKEQRTAKPGHSKSDKHAVTKKPMTTDGTLGSWRAC